MIEAAQKHLLSLQAAGVGYRQAAKLAGVSCDTIQRIRSGRASKVGTDILAAILGVKAKPAPGAVVNAYATKRLLRALKAEGFTEGQIAQRLGLRRRAVEWDSKGIRVSNANKVEALFQRVTNE